MKILFICLYGRELSSLLTVNFLTVPSSELANLHTAHELGLYMIKLTKRRRR